MGRVCAKTYRDVHLHVVQHTATALRLLVDVDVPHHAHDAVVRVGRAIHAALQPCVGYVGPTLDPLVGNGCEFDGAGVRVCRHCFVCMRVYVACVQCKWTIQL